MCFYFVFTVQFGRAICFSGFFGGGCYTLYSLCRMAFPVSFASTEWDDPPTLYRIFLTNDAQGHSARSTDSRSRDSTNSLQATVMSSEISIKSKTIRRLEVGEAAARCGSFTMEKSWQKPWENGVFYHGKLRFFYHGKWVILPWKMMILPWNMVFYHENLWFYYETMVILRWKVHGGFTVKMLETWWNARKKWIYREQC